MHLQKVFVKKFLDINKKYYNLVNREIITGSKRVNRGGSWNNNADNCRVANRNNNNADNRNNNLGFRLALSPIAHKHSRIAVSEQRLFYFFRTIKRNKTELRVALSILELVGSHGFGSRKFGYFCENVSYQEFLLYTYTTPKIQNLKYEKLLY